MEQIEKKKHTHVSEWKKNIKENQMEYANKIIICMSANARTGQGRLYGYTCIIDIVMSSIKSNKNWIKWVKKKNEVIAREAVAANNISSSGSGNGNQQHLEHCIENLVPTRCIRLVVAAPALTSDIWKYVLCAMCSPYGWLADTKNEYRNQIIHTYTHTYTFSHTHNTYGLHIDPVLMLTL